MNQQYWDDLAKNFDDRVFEIAANELNGRLATVIKKLGKRYKIAGDFGCGVGGTTSILAANFDKVIAVDYAQKLLQQAQRRVRAKNVRFVKADLVAKKRPAVKVDVSFCINALIHPVAKKRQRIAESVFACTKKGGKAIVVVPSLESFLHTYQVLVECLVKQGQQRKKAIRKISSAAKSEVHSLVEGIVDVGETATKHYMHDEIVQLLEEVGFAVQSIDRVEFPWAEVIDHPPQWLKKPYPWDWMVVAGR